MNKLTSFFRQVFGSKKMPLEELQRIRQELLNKWGVMDSAPERKRLAINYESQSINLDLANFTVDQMIALADAYFLENEKVNCIEITWHQGNQEFSSNHLRIYFKNKSFDDSQNVSNHPDYLGYQHSSSVVRYGGKSGGIYSNCHSTFHVYSKSR